MGISVEQRETIFFLFATISCVATIVGNLKVCHKDCTAMDGNVHIAIAFWAAIVATSIVAPFNAKGATFMAVSIALQSTIVLLAVISPYNKIWCRVVGAVTIGCIVVAIGFVLFT